LTTEYLTSIKNEGFSLSIRVFYLESFINSDITANYLANVQKDFDTIRAAGLKMIIRFAYSNDIDLPKKLLKSLFYGI
jgi:hypothetical protein